MRRTDSRLSARGPSSTDFLALLSASDDDGSRDEHRGAEPPEAWTCQSLQTYGIGLSGKGDVLPGKTSLKIIAPSTAVTMKLALVLITLTRTVLLAKVSARVKRPHMTALKARFMAKKNYHMISLSL